MEPQAYAFGRFWIDVASRQLLRDGTHVPLAAKAFDTLLELVRHRDRAVTRDELMKAVWPDTFVSDDSLTQSISVLRRTFADAEIIATIPRRGYRFIVPVVEDPPPDWEALRETAAARIREPGLGTRDPGSAVQSVPKRASEPSPQMSDPGSGSRVPDPGSRRAIQRRRWLAIAAALVAVAAALLIWRTLSECGTTAAPPLLRFTQEASPGTAIPSGGVLCSLANYRMQGFYTIQAQADYDAWLVEQRFTQ